MSFHVQFYDPANILTGGAISGNELGSLQATSEQVASAADFASATSEQVAGGTNYYHRKIWLTNNDSDDILTPEIWLEDVEYPDQVFVARELAADDTTADPYSIPSGYETSDFVNAVAVEDRIPLFSDTSELSAGSDAAVWIRLAIPPVHAADPSALFSLRIRGVRDV